MDIHNLDTEMNAMSRKLCECSNETIQIRNSILTKLWKMLLLYFTFQTVFTHHAISQTSKTSLSCYIATRYNSPPTTIYKVGSIKLSTCGYNGLQLQMIFLKFK